MGMARHSAHTHNQIWALKHMHMHAHRQYRITAWVLHGARGVAAYLGDAAHRLSGLPSWRPAGLLASEVDDIAGLTVLHSKEGLAAGGRYDGGRVHAVHEVLLAEPQHPHQHKEDVLACRAARLVVRAAAAGAGRVGEPHRVHIAAGAQHFEVGVRRAADDVHCLVRRAVQPGAVHAQRPVPAQSR